MRFEKLNEDKIRITLSHDDLVKKDIDFHSFMSNSIESQALFFDMLEEAEKEIGFVTKDYLICEYCVDEDIEWGLDKHGNGENRLGKAWMNVRNEISEL